MNPSLSPLALLLACLATAAAGMLAHARLHRHMPAAVLPARGTMAAAMLGMLAGLAFDAAHGRLALLVSLCGAGLPLSQLLRWHFDLLSASNAALVLGGSAPLLWQALSRCCTWRRLLSTLLCLALMLAGMNLGMPLFARAAQLRATSLALPPLLGAMQAGMAWGAALALGLLRAHARGPAARVRVAGARG